MQGAALDWNMRICYEVTHIPEADDFSRNFSVLVISYWNEVKIPKTNFVSYLRS
jgi:hypothetical protein